MCNSFVHATNLSFFLCPHWDWFWSPLLMPVSAQRPGASELRGAWGVTRLGRVSGKSQWVWQLFLFTCDYILYSNISVSLPLSLWSITLLCAIVVFRSPHFSDQDTVSMTNTCKIGLHCWQPVTGNSSSKLMNSIRSSWGEYAHSLWWAGARTLFTCVVVIRELMSTFNIDVVTDSCDVHHQYFCNTCNTKMQQYIHHY